MYRKRIVIGIGLILTLFLVSCANKTGTDVQNKDMQKQTENLQQQVGQTQQQTVPAGQVVPEQSVSWQTNMQQAIPEGQAIPQQAIPEGQVIPQQSVSVQQAIPQGQATMQQRIPVQDEDPFQGGPGVVGQSTSLTINRAKQIAVADAGVELSSAVFIKASSDFDDGIMRWELDFVSGNTKYEYEVSSTDGTILKKEIEVIKQDGFPQEANPYQQTLAVDPTGHTGTKVDANKAREIAVQHSGADIANVILTKQEYDIEHATPRWEIEFVIGNLQYEYEISAVNGAILKFKTKKFTLD